ncbi:hypothetical protein EV05_1458 [Prochlorococcus sp. MIT 0601]|nr:hypothetical protein EV05_1458 [Prochlorococcus sp. MIT 0601]
MKSLIEAGLKYWVIKQCISIGKINLKINSSTLSILKGAIPMVSLEASSINFRNIIIDKIFINAKNIKLKFIIRKGKPSVELLENFFLKFTISFTSDQINNICLSEDWKSLGDFFTTEFFLDSTFKKIEIDDNLFKVKVLSNESNQMIEKLLKIDIKSGKLNFTDIDSNKNSILPIDKSIKVNIFNFNQKTLTLVCTSEVTI